MPGVRRVDNAQIPRFLAVNQFKLGWQHFSHSEMQPSVNGTRVHASVAMRCEFDFAEGGDVLVCQDRQRKWRLGHITVKCLMDKSRSIAWAVPLRKNTAEQNAELLKHERVHVELAERHARYIFQQIQQLSVLSSDTGAAAQQLINAADQIRKNHWKKLDAINSQYDRETAHGTNTQIQQRWNQIYLSKTNTNATL